MQTELRNWLLISTLVFALVIGTSLAVTRLITANSSTNPQLSLFAEVTSPNSSAKANFSFLIPGISTTSSTTRYPDYTLTNTPQGMQVQILLRFNTTESISLTVNQLTNNKTSSPYPPVFREIPTSRIRSQNLSVYIEYTATGEWPFGSLPLYRDAYLYQPGFDSPVEFTTTGTITLVYFLFGGIGFLIATLILALVIPIWRRRLLFYFPWVTFSLSFIMTWGFIFVGTPVDYERVAGVIADVFSTIPHFTTDHLLGNLTRGFIIAGVLVESWVGYAEQSIFKRRLQLLLAMFLMDTGSGLVSYVGSTFSIGFLQIGGFGASYTVEVWASLLMIVVLTKQAILQRTSLLYKLYPLLVGISGFALLNYVYEWFLAGFVLGGGASTSALATNHIIAFFLGLGIIGLFYGVEYVWMRIRPRTSSEAGLPAVSLID